jgi:hypothetical protein
MSNDDLRKRFESADPARRATDEWLDRSLSTAKIVEFALVDSGRRRRWRFHRKWKRAGIFTASLVLVAGGSVAALTLLREPAQNTTQLTCFATTAQGSNATVVSLTTHPLRTCQSIMHWARLPQPNSRGALCVLSNGSIGGYPPSLDRNECGALGLATYNGHLQNSRAEAFQMSAQNYFAAHHCQSLIVARHAMVQLLNRFDVAGWSVRVSGSRSPKACATLAVLAKDKAVDIVGIKF